MKTIRLFLLILAIPFLFSIASCKSNRDQYLAIPDQEKLNHFLDKYVNEGFYPFLYARIEDKHGNVVYEHGAINNKLIPGVEINGKTWFKIWSMSKIVTITVALDLEEEGILSLDDPVTKYIPEFESLKVAVTPDGISLSALNSYNAGIGCNYLQVPVDSIMTIRHLINHQAGFYYATTGFECIDSLIAAKNLPKSENSEQLIRKLAELPILHQPGERYYYGTNTTVLGLVIERATGKNLKQLVAEHITEPMNIEGLQYGLPDHTTLLPSITGKDTVLRIVQHGELNIFGPDVIDYDSTNNLYLGGEGMLATAEGYADFLRILLNGGILNGYRFLNESTVAEIHAPHTLTDNASGYNGYNLWVSTDTLKTSDKGYSGLWSGGGYEGTHFWIDPNHEFVGLIMTQMFWMQPEGYGLNEKFKTELYKQLSSVR